MNCTRCGQPLAPGAAACPFCGTPAYAQPAQQQVYQQSYVQYQQGQYPPGYQQPYMYGQAAPQEESGFLAALSDLPRAFLGSFTRPGEVLRGMVEKRDHVSCPVVAGLVLLLTFLCGTLLMRGFVSVLMSVLSALTGVSMASTSASMNQGVSYIAGRVGPMAGGVAALCQLLAMLIPAAVFMVYICAVCKVAFSWDLFLGFLTVASLPTVAASLLAMALSLLSPWLALLVIVCGAAVSLTQSCGMLSLITARPDNDLLAGKVVCTALSVALTLLAGAVAGGLLMRGVMQSTLVLLNRVGSLI